MSVIQSKILFEDDKVYHATSQPSEHAILERNSELRKNVGAFHDLGERSGETWGRLAATIPFIMYEKALRDGYDLNSKDKARADQEMLRYLRSTEGRMCLVR